MFARVTLLEIDAVRADIDAVLDAFRREIMPQVRDQPGYQGLFVLSTPEGAGLVMSLWTDEASHLLERMPPYLQHVIRPEVEDFIREAGDKLVTFARVHQARQGGRVAWEQDAEERLERVPAPVRAMARIELERTALERGQTTVTVSLMEEVKARYFGLFAHTGTD